MIAKLDRIQTTISQSRQKNNNTLRASTNNEPTITESPHQGLHCLLRQKRYSEKVENDNLELYNGPPQVYYV